MCVPKYTLKEARQARGMSVSDLVRESQVSRSVITRIENGDTTSNVRRETAQLLAGAVGYRVDEIAWPKGISDLGRPPLTGVAISRTRTVSFTVTETVTPVCSVHQLALRAADGGCDYCDYCE